MHPFKEYRITVNRNEIAPMRLGVPQTPGFTYNVFAESDTSHEKLTSVKNKPLYDAIDEGLATFLMLLAVRNEKAIVRVQVQGLPFSHGGKQMIRDKYAAEMYFVNFYFD
ncbi:hypothetical protein [Paenisporosarcina sp. NPDC076898]|uniref:hypothetical protein n=1 Tax=unclassified Paenisporosarcina TaxID=2642018 RepID=UPI003D03F325